MSNEQLRDEALAAATVARSHSIDAVVAARSAEDQAINAREAAEIAIAKLEAMEFNDTPPPVDYVGSMTAVQGAGRHRVRHYPGNRPVSIWSRDWTGTAKLWYDANAENVKAEFDGTGHLFCTAGVRYILKRISDFDSSYRVSAVMDYANTNQGKSYWDCFYFWTAFRFGWNNDSEQNEHYILRQYRGQLGDRRMDTVTIDGVKWDMYLGQHNDSPGNRIKAVLAAGQAVPESVRPVEFMNYWLNERWVSSESLYWRDMHAGAELHRGTQKGKWTASQIQIPSI
jgi:hypothetical protein